jgi:hypothetical protein
MQTKSHFSRAETVHQDVHDKLAKEFKEQQHKLDVSSKSFCLRIKIES